MTTVGAALSVLLIHEGGHIVEPTFHPGDILQETRAAISACLGNNMETLAVERTVIGLFFTGLN
jgi:hypothetical protein